MAWRNLKRLAVARGGSTAILIGAAAPFAVFIGLLMTDYAGALMLRNSLQAAAEGAALAGAKQLLIAGGGQRNAALAVAEDYALAQTRDLPVATANVAAHATEGDRAGDPTVMVAIEAKPRSLFAALASPPLIHVSAEALPVGSRSLCVMGLSASGEAISATGGSAIAANGCMIHSNSKDRRGLVVRNGASISGEQISVVGGYEGATIAPQPMTGAREIEDPLAARPKPQVGACDFVKKSLNRLLQRWTPGVYCDGMYLNNGANVTLQPGVYVIKGGTVNVEGGARLSGEGVTLFLTAGARLNILPNSTIDLTAPATGPTAGMLIYGDPDSPPSAAHKLQANSARQLLGVIYLPGGALSIGGGKDMADRSPWTAIVAGKINVAGQGRVVLNSRYDETPVPAPPTLSGARDIRLVN